MKVEWKETVSPFGGQVFGYFVGGLAVGMIVSPSGGLPLKATCCLTGAVQTMDAGRAKDACDFVEAEVKRWAAEYLAAVACRPGSSDGSDKSDGSDGSDGSDKAAEAGV